MTTVAFRVDADERIGLGHAMRCLALADALRARGATTAFVAAALPEATAAAFRARGHVVLTLANAASAPSGEPDDALDEAGQRADALAARQALATLGALDWIVVDHYGLGAAWERAAAAFAHRVAVIDDNAWRAHDCDLLIDHNVSAQWAQYDALLPPRALRLVGPRFALLRREFARDLGASPRVRTTIERLLVSFGGADPTRETEKVLNALLADDLRVLRADIVLGAANPRGESIGAVAQKLAAATLHVEAENMSALLDRADLAVGAAGVSALERCVKGVPSLLVVVATNQIRIAQALASRGAAVLLGRSEEVSSADIADALRELLSRPARLAALSRAAAAVCDHSGAHRVADVMLG